MAVDATNPEQWARADRGAVVNQAARDAYHIERHGDQPLLTALRPGVEHGDGDPTVRGRDDLLDSLQCLLEGDGPGPRVRILHGMGGCGKTTVARELAARAHRLGIGTWWIHAGTAESVAAGMRALAVEL